MANEHTCKADAPQTGQHPTPSIQEYPDIQCFSQAHANAPRTENNAISRLRASLDAGEFEKANTEPVTTNQTPVAQKSFVAPGGIWVFTWNEIVNAIIQVVAVIAALVFGAWAIKSYDEAQQANALARTGLQQTLIANQQTLIANQLALLAVCASNEDIGNSTACADVFAAISLDSIVFALHLVPAIPPSRTSTFAPPTSTSFPSITTTITSIYHTILPSSPPSTITMTPTGTSTTTASSSVEASAASHGGRQKLVPTLPTIIGIVVSIICTVAVLLAGYIGLSRRGRVQLQE